MLRLGYVMVEDRWLIPLSWWHYMLALSLTRWTRQLVTVRAVVYDTSNFKEGDDEDQERPMVMQGLDDASWKSVRFWKLSIAPVE